MDPAERKPDPAPVVDPDVAALRDLPLVLREGVAEAKAWRAEVAEARKEFNGFARGLQLGGAGGILAGAVVAFLLVQARDWLRRLNDMGP